MPNDFPKTRDLLLALALLNLTPNRTRLLLETFNPFPDICRASAAMLSELLSIAEPKALLVKQALQNAGRNETIACWRDRVVTLADAGYPQRLREICDAPPVLWLEGDPSLFDRPSLAIVGSRRASPYAINVAARLARELAEAGITIVSGLAYGVDAAAHEATLDAGGTTIAVLGTGIDLCYPPRHRRLFDRIAAAGLLMTELPPATPPRKQNFPIRNRLIAGMTQGTIVVEASGRSGSLITARMAVENGREVFAVPGSIFSPGSEGTHRLIQSGAKLLHDLGDLYDELPELRPARPPGVTAESLPEELREVLWVFVRDEARHIDFAAEQLGRPVESLAAPLLQLELHGALRKLPGARYIRVA